MFGEKTAHGDTAIAGEDIDMELGTKSVTLFDVAEAEMVKMPPVYMPLEHAFTSSMYRRTIFMPKGTLVSTRIHKTEHFFSITKGHVQIIEPDGNKEIKAPFSGVTYPGTQRLIYIVEDTTWETYHVTDLTDPDLIAEQITEHHNPLLDKEDPRLQAYKSEPALT